MHEIDGRIRSYKDTPWCSNPKAYQNIVHEDDNVIVFKDRFPVTEGHLLYVPKKVTQQLDITRCFELAYKRGVRGICEHEWDAFNVGINNGEAAGQSVMWPHVHLIPRRKGDTPNPRGGVRGVIPMNQDYKETRVVMGVCFGEKEMKENTERFKKVDDEATRMPMSAPIVLVEPAPCSRTALVRDRAIDEFMTEHKGKSWEKVDDATWDKVVQRMRNKERKKEQERKRKKE